MKYLLDTNICIYIIKQKPEQVIRKFRTFAVGDVCISSVTLAEMMYGIEKSLYPPQNKAALEAFILPLEIMPFEEVAAYHYGRIRAQLERQGMPIGPLDLMIAAHADCLNAILVTNNKREFLRIPQLKIEDWTQAP